MSLENKILTIAKEERDKRSQELFDKNESELTLEESLKLERYIHDLNNPIWKDIMIDNKFSGYQISNIGLIRNKSGQIMSPYYNNNGYLGIRVSFNNKRYSFLMHRLVAIAFIANSDNKPQVNHINGKKNINWVGNLEWNTRNENMQHAAANDLLKPNYGESSPFAKHTEAEIIKACELLEKNYPYSYVSALSGVGRKTLEGIKSGKKWKHISNRYNIPKPSSSRWTPDLKYKIDNLINKNYNSNNIIAELKLEKNKSTVLWIDRRIRKVKSSSTIGQL